MASKVYFPGLNGLRFMAAFAVIITHVELMKKFIGFSNVWRLVEPIAPTPAQAIMASEKYTWAMPLVSEAGPLGVVFFFVLSGFLITYLLFAEKKEHKTISVKDFYLRRILRIWPLYYFVFILGFFILPEFDLFFIKDQTPYLEGNFWQNFWLYLIILPNLALAASPLGISVPNIGQSWSIGVEEQFYLIWPLIVRYMKKPFNAILWVTGIYLLLKVAVLIILMSYSPHWMIVLKKFLVMSKIECMTIGALGAYYFFYKKKNWLKLAYHPAIQILSLIGIPIVLYFSPFILQNGIHLVYAVLFLIIILNVSTNKKSFLKLENKVFGFLGRISYGIYMYHMMVIVFILNFLKSVMHWPADLNYIQNAIIYISATGLTVLVSYISYSVFESRFIKLKKKHTKIISGEEAKT